MMYLILVAFSIFVSPCQMKEADNIRLIGSSLQYAGQVQISTRERQWASICAVGWDKKDAEVVCRQLNYSAAEAAILGEAFGHAPGEVDNKKFNCVGNESSLWQCPTSKNVTCYKNNVAAVLCKPNDLTPLFILISLVGCLALTSITILIMTCRAMFAGKKRCPARECEIGLSNANIERDLEVCSSTEGKRELKGSSETFSSGSYSNFEDVENLSYPVESLNTNNKKRKETPNSVSNAELIESISSLEVHHNDIEQEELKRKESRKEKYMSLLKSSRAFLHFYEKLLKRNKNRQSATDIDDTLDYYSSDQYNKDWPSINNDIDISSDEEYHEIYPEEEQHQEKVDKDKNDSEYVPMLSLSLMHSRKLSVTEETQEEYLDILPPGPVGKEKISPGSSKRNSDYLHPVDAHLPAFPEASDNMASCSYDEELPQPPQDLTTLTNNYQDNKNRRSPSGQLGLSHQTCRCEEEKDLMCRNCLDCHAMQNIVDQELDGELEYVSMDHCRGEKGNKAVDKNLRRNSADYTIPIKSSHKNKKEYGSFPEELNKNNLNRKIKNDTFQSCDKELVPNKKEKFNAAAKGATKEKGHRGSSSPQNARKEDEKLSNEKSPNPEKTAKCDVTTMPSFLRTKDFFENNRTVANSLDKTKTKKAAFSKRLFNSEENESSGIPIPTSSTSEKPRSESCPVEVTNGAKPSSSFITALENVLKAREGTEGISERDEKEMEMDTENDYELDYEDISHTSPDESKYENNDISSGSRPGSYEYDYVHEKHRKSLHFYEAVSKKPEESEEDQYENMIDLQIVRE